MASLFKRPRSPFWWIKYRDGNGKIIRESTHLRFVQPAESRQARVLESKRTTEELQTRANLDDMAWDMWVVGFLETKHAHNPNTVQRYRLTWHTIRDFLRENTIPTPVTLTRSHCLSYPAWRRKFGHFNSPKRRPIHHNTILLELKLLSSICSEAVARGFINGNPCHRLGLKKVAPAVKEEMTDEHVRIIRAEIDRLKAKARTVQAPPEAKQLAHFLEVSFHIAIHQGIRMKETNLDLTAVNFDAMEILIHAKGDKYYTAPLNPNLAPFLQRLKDEGRKTAYDPPRMPSFEWFKFFNRLRKRHPDMARISFHSTRVTVISRLERSGAPENRTMKLVNHASTTVHRSYRRMKRNELSPYWDALNEGGGDKPGPPETPDAPSTTPTPTPASSGDHG